MTDNSTGASSDYWDAETAAAYDRGTGNFRYVWPAELDLMARLPGLEPERRTADWAGAPFTSDSEGHVSVWRKPS
jgi:hypothetical protein